MTVIQFCENNFVHSTEEVVKKLEENFPEVSVEIEACLGYCDDCAAGPYALVDDELIQADSAEDLYEAIVDVINER